MKKYLSIVLVICMLFTLAMPVFAADEAQAVILIGTAEEFNAFRDTANAGDSYAGKTVELTADIDLGGITWTPVKKFTGKFYGNNHTISNFNIDATATHGGIFNELTSAEVKDLTISNVTATVGNYRFGTLARSVNMTYINNVTVKNVAVTTSASEGFVSGLVCHGTVNSEVSMNDCTVENLTVNAEKGAMLIGGIATFIQRNGTEADGTNIFKNLTVKNFKVVVNDNDSYGCDVGGIFCQTQSVWQNPRFNDCIVTDLDVTASGKVNVGGFLCKPGSVTFAENCSVEGEIDVSGVTSAESYAGGFFGSYGWGDNIGKGDHLVVDCQADVDIATKIAKAGGFVGTGTNSEGKNKTITFINCTAKGDVELIEGGTALIGGFVGDADRGTYINCSSTKDTLIGEELENYPIVIKTCEAMVNGECYETLADAIAAAEDGSTVKLLMDVIVSEAITIDGNIAITGDYTITGADGYTGDLFELEEGADLTLSIEHTYNVDSATCQVAKICLTCGKEFEGVKDHTYIDYVYNNDATCMSDGTKTAECIYGCGETDTVIAENTVAEHTYVNYVSNKDATCYEDGTKTAGCIYKCGETDTVVDEGSMYNHGDYDHDGNCDRCSVKLCDYCNGTHESFFAEIACFVTNFIKMIMNLFKF